MTIQFQIGTKVKRKMHNYPEFPGTVFLMGVNFIAVKYEVKKGLEKRQFVLHLLPEQLESAE